MEDKAEVEEGNVTVSMSLEGEYEEVMSKMQTEATESRSLNPLLEDITILLDTVEQINGGTRSAIAQALPDSSSLAGDADAVVETLQVLSRYDLVTLEGNTWLPSNQVHDE